MTEKSGDLRFVRAGGGTSWHRNRAALSWSVVLLPLVLSSACGGTVVRHDDGDGGPGGSETGGAGGSMSSGGAHSGGSAAGGVTHSTGGTLSAGGAIATGGTINTGGAAGSGGSVHREPAQHRATADFCLVVPGNSAGGSAGTPFPDGECTVDADCTNGKNGRCVAQHGTYCTYDTCYSDAECESGAACLCSTPGGRGNRCGELGCRVDADCPGSWCSPTFGTCGGFSGVIGYACHSNADECIDDSDCGDPIGVGAPYCAFSPMVGHWLCSTSACVG